VAPCYCCQPSASFALILTPEKSDPAGEMTKRSSWALLPLGLLALETLSTGGWAPGVGTQEQTAAAADAAKEAGEGGL